MKKIAIRELAFFVYQSGALTNESSLNKDAQDGTHLHQLRQSEYQKDQIKEYYINKTIEYNNEKINLNGYIDGVLDKKNSLILEEIKTTSHDLFSEDFSYKEEHLAQVKLYAYFMFLETDFNEVKLNLLYINRKNYLRRNFEFVLSKKEINEFFYNTLDIYLSFVNKTIERQKNRIITTKYIDFPFEKPRDGQLKMSSEITKHFIDKEILYCLAPTGIGKTMSSIYGAIKAMSELSDKLFYLTAKSSGKMSAIRAIKLLISKGLKIKVLELSNKHRMCNKGCNICHTDECEFAKHFFDNLLEATSKIIEENDIITSNVVMEYAEKYQICAFEFSLNISTNVDMIICDYNYVFDPKVKLIRFFEDTKYLPYILVDESHNLANRSLSMYSTQLSTLNLNIIKKITSQFDNSNISSLLLKLINYIRRKYENIINYNNIFYQNENDDELVDYIRLICEEINYILENNDDIKEKDRLLENYFILKDFLRISDLYSSSHRFVVKNINNNIYISLTCLNASKYLFETYKNHTNGITYFSATLNPIEYYKEMLSENNGDYLELKSPFDSNNLEILLAPISTKYNDRDKTLSDIINIVNETINVKKGKYIVFFPSYDYLNLFLSNFQNDDYQLIIQNQQQKLTDLEVFNEFSKNQNTLGLFVLGGSFSEGIDLYGDLLHGVIVVGVGLPQINFETNLSKEYFNELNLNGFDYAYTYPGFTKVVQAAGRVIRTEEDKGILLLIDNRYLYKNYRNMFPSHWQNIKTIKNLDDISKNLDEFWFNKK